MRLNAETALPALDSDRSMSIPTGFYHYGLDIDLLPCNLKPARIELEGFILALSRGGFFFKKVSKPQ